MSRSKKTTATTALADAFAKANITLPKKEVKKKYEWKGRASRNNGARTTSSTLARTLVCGTKKTGHPQGLADLDEQAPLLMMDIMDGLK